MSLQPFTLFSFNISACGFVLVGPKKIKKIITIIIIIIKLYSTVEQTAIVYIRM